MPVLSGTCLMLKFDSIAILVEFVRVKVFPYVVLISFYNGSQFSIYNLKMHIILITYLCIAL